MKSILILTFLLASSGCYVSNDSEPQSDAAKVSRECLETYGKLLAENYRNAPTDSSYESGQWLYERNTAAHEAAFKPMNELRHENLKEWDAEKAKKLFHEIANGYDK